MAEEHRSPKGLLGVLWGFAGASIAAFFVHSWWRMHVRNNNPKERDRTSTDHDSINAYRHCSTPARLRRPHGRSRNIASDPMTPSASSLHDFRFDLSSDPATIHRAIAQIPDSVKNEIIRSNSMELAHVALLESLRNMFRMIDSNSSGCISRDQLIVFLTTLGFSDARNEALTILLGFQSSSTVDFEQFCKVLASLLSPPKPSVAPCVSASESLSKFGVSLARAQLPSLEPSLGSAEPPISPPTVFLGGSCGATTWRKDIAAPLLSQHGISFYDPQVVKWNPHLMVLEDLMKACCRALLFVVDASTRSVASMVEAAEYITSGREVVLVINYFKPLFDERRLQGASSEILDAEVPDLNRGRLYLAGVAQRHHVSVFDSVEGACMDIVRRYAHPNV